MSRAGKVYCRGECAGRIEEVANGFRFTYARGFLSLKDAKPVSLTMPLREAPYESENLFPFFYGLLAEGILKETQCRKLHIDENDHFGLLLKTAHDDTIGDVTVLEEPEV